MLIFNYPGIGMLILGFIIGAFATNSMHGSPFGASIGGLVAGGIDFYLRSNNENAWFHPDGGGHIWFIPVWIIGAIAAIVGVIAALGGH
jgi:hypothetical protein